MSFDQEETKSRSQNERLYPGFAPDNGRPFSRLWYLSSNWFFYHLEDEIRRAEPLIWFVLLFLLGIVVYFAAPQEPEASVLCVLTVGTGCLLWRWRQQSVRFYTIASLFSLIAGFTAASLHTTLNSTVVLAQPVTVMMEATVERYERRARGTKRVIFRDIEVIGEDRSADIPARVRLSLPGKGIVVRPNDRLRFLARLNPPPGPVLPGGYDFARDLFFKNIGAIGFIYGAPDVIHRASSLSARSLFSREYWRASIGERVSAAFIANGQEQAGSIAAALLIGDRGGVSEETRASFAVSGLAHILAISGLHMALVVTFVIFLIRAALATSQHVALNYPIRNIAVMGGLVTGLAYYVVSGGSVSATRAFMMVGIMALALLFGKRALNVRNVALAGLTIMALNPVAAISPGFQMSFIATISLVVFAGYWIGAPKNSNQPNSFLHRLFKVAQRYLFGLIVTSLLAGFSTGLFAAFHFHRIAPMGLIANLLGIPIFSLLVMPFGFLGMLAMPFGFELPFFAVMGYGIEQIVTISGWLSDFSKNIATTGQLERSAFFLTSMSFLLFCLLKSKLRLLMVPFFLLGFFSLKNGGVPDIFISEDGKTVALRQERDLLVSGARSGKFEIKVWRAAARLSDSLLNPGTLAQKQQSARTKGAPVCDAYGCIFQTNDMLIAHTKHPSGFYEDCRRANLVISEFSAPQYCAETAHVIDRNILRSSGAHTVSINSNFTDDPTVDRFSVFSAIPSLKRPWHHQYTAKR